MSVTLTRPNGQTLTFDASPRQSHSPQVELTEHSVEDGVSISDHGQPKAREITITGVVSETPLGGTGGPARVDEALRFLNEAGEGVERLELSTRLGTSTGWVLMSWPHDVTVVRGLVFELALRQIRVATSTTITLPREIPVPRYADKAPPNADVGSQPNEFVGPSQGDAVIKSWAASMLDRFTGGP
ncbi:MAG: phage baseplate protein [Bradymonadaceae bacterium]